MGQIIEETGYSKASVSLWTRDILLTEIQRKGISKRGRSMESIERRRASRLKNEESKRRLIMEEASREIRFISRGNLKVIGTMLYWAEGRKRGSRIVTFSNSDPLMIRTMMKFFREICRVNEKKFRGSIHIHTNGKTTKAEKYWSNISGIPLNQFYKTYTLNSVAGKGKMRSLPHGTFDIYVCDSKLFLTIMGWIEKIGILTNQ